MSLTLGGLHLFPIDKECSEPSPEPGEPALAEVGDPETAAAAGDIEPPEQQPTLHLGEPQVRDGAAWPPDGMDDDILS
eukprot:11182041-Prorocentrum_lima.AAC.1